MTKNNSIQSLIKNVCTGCKMCADICPKNCISFNEDDEGFFYPIVDDARCVDCGLCKKKCPGLNQSCNERTNVAISAFASDQNVKVTGSSGGIFYLLAANAIDNGGVVYGAAFDGQLKLRHCRVNSIDDLRPLCKSKYLQSDCRGIYSLVRSDLADGKFVLFVGTPCQCQALKNYIGEKMSSNLLLVDFACHGVPNQKLFDDNLQWNKHKYGNVLSVEYRYKGKGVKHPQTLEMVYEKAGIRKSILRMHYQDPYYFGFQRHIILRPSCYQCEWAQPERCSDITLADFWGIEKANIGLDSKKGVSCVLLNSDKGEKAYAAIAHNLTGVNELPVDFAIKNNGCLGSPTIEPKNRKQFFEDWKALGYDAVINNYLMPKRKWVYDVYYSIPTPIRKILRKIMDKRMKYE